MTAVVCVAACQSGSDGGGTAGNAGTSGAVGSAGTTGSAGVTGSAGTTGTGGSVGTTGGAGVTGGGSTGTTGSAGTGGGAGATDTGGRGGAAGTTGSAGAAAGSGGQSGGAGRGQAGTGGASAGQAGAGGGAGRATGSGGQAGSVTGAGGAVVSNCQGNAWPTADPTIAGPFEVTSDKNVGPLAGVVPDPVYGNTQQRFNVYRPKDLAQGGYCHPILVWANGHTDNPEPNPPLCLTGNGQYCGSYLMLMNQLASHGFVVIASLSTITSQGTPVPTIVGLDWLLQQADDPASPYYHRLDTAHIGALGHSEGGASTCIAASDPRISAISTVSGARANAGFHQPALFFCGGKDTVVSCDSVANTYKTITNQPAMLIDNLAADHGGWLYQNGVKGPDIFGLTAWFRVHLMADTANRKYFYGANCTFCTDTRVTVMRNALLTQ